MAAILQQEPCPKCKGQLYLEKDHAGCYVSCLQCGYLRDIPRSAERFTLPLVQAKGIK